MIHGDNRMESVWSGSRQWQYETRKGCFSLGESELYNDGIVEYEELQMRYSVYLQPIVCIDPLGIAGYEVFLRRKSDTYLDHAPLDLLEARMEHSSSLQLDRFAHEAGMQRHRELNLPGCLFLNTCHTTVLQSLENPPELVANDRTHLKDIPAGQHLSPGKVFIEISAQIPVEDYHILRESINVYKQAGYSIALDHCGPDYASRRLLTELAPHCVKIDPRLARINANPELDRKRKRKLELLCDIISAGSETMLIVEGIESVQELEQLKHLDIRYLQGKLLGKPSLKPVSQIRLFPFNLETRHSSAGCVDSDNRVNMGCWRPKTGYSAGDICDSAPSVSPNCTMEELCGYFTGQHGYYEIVPIITAASQASQGHSAMRPGGRKDADTHQFDMLPEGTPVGVITRTQFLNFYLQRYGRDLHGRKKVYRFMSPLTSVFQQDVPVEEVGLQVAEDEDTSNSDNFFVVTDLQGRYLGIITLRRLLKVITRLQIRNAEQANPLTGLQGNGPINELIDFMLQKGVNFAVCYCDLDHFKPFNDVYGFSRGDDVLRFTAHVLQQYIDPKVDFVGHIGGDDFIVIYQSSDWHEQCLKILADFDHSIPRFYDLEHRNKGIVTTDREGKEKHYPAIGLSIGVFTPPPGKYKSHHEVASAATEAKRCAKKKKGSYLFVDRRNSNAW